MPVTVGSGATAYPAGLMSAPSPALFAQLLDALPGAVALLDIGRPGWPVVWANPGFSRLTGMDPRRDSVGWLDFADPQVEGLCGEGALARLVSQPGEARWLPRRGGVELSGHCAPLREMEQGPSYLLLTLGEAPGAVTGRLPAVPRWSSAQRLDPVTGLPQREPFEEMLRRDWGMARRTRRRVSVILFRIDALESYRALFGRHATDSCIKRIAGVLTGSLRRAGDYCARFDGNCLAALVDNEQELQVRALASQLGERVRSLGIHHPRVPSRFVTVTWGVASAVPEDEAGAAGLLEAAAGMLAAMPAEVTEATARSEAASSPLRRPA